MKKIFFFTIISFIVSIFIFSEQSTASDINLGPIYLHTSDYQSEDIDIEEHQLSNASSVTIKDKQTGETLETIKCQPINSIGSNTSSDSTSDYVITRTKSDELASVQLRIRVRLYQQGSFSSIQSIESSEMVILYNNVPFYEEGQNCSARSLNDTFPSNEIEYLGNIRIATKAEVKDTTHLSVGDRDYSLNELEAMGYGDFSHLPNQGQTLYLRKKFTIQGEFKSY